MTAATLDTPLMEQLKEMGAQFNAAQAVMLVDGASLEEIARAAVAAIDRSRGTPLEADRLRALANGVLRQGEELLRIARERQAEEAKRPRLVEDDDGARTSPSRARRRSTCLPTVR